MERAVSQMTREEVLARIEAVGVIPAIRTASADDARFAIEAVSSGGIPIVEITMEVPGALDVITDLVRHAPGLIVGAGTVLDLDTARRCADAGATFLTSPGLDLQIVDFAHKNGIVMLPGALTPTEVIMAWRAGSDFVKVFPCAWVGADAYIRALKAPLPTARLIAAGGVNQQTAASYILAGASAIGVGTELIPRAAIQRRQASRLHELAHRFVNIVATARGQMREPHHDSAARKAP
jgi:2-dehydro-3-deoxyphosphogluconate aldolase/(4S)-4-hydroxy-2-oxoglutarate aldolase